MAVPLYIDRTPSLTNSDGTSTSSASIREPSPTPSSRRPLPPLPIKAAVRDQSPPARVYMPTVAGRPPSRVMSPVPLLLPPPLGLPDLLKHSRILRGVLQELAWTDFQAVARTCYGCRDALFEAEDLREVVLARFVPGYRYCAIRRDPQWFQDVEVTMTDLELLAISETLPLHRFPTHALAVLSSPQRDPELHARTKHLAALAHAHSRFVLLLQSLVHSAPPGPPEPEDPPPVRPQATQTGIRELTFPAPLYYTGADAKEKPPITSAPSAPRGAMPSATPRPSTHRRGQPSRSGPSAPHFLSSTSSSDSAHSSFSPPTSLKMVKSRSFGILGRSTSKIPLPPPRAEPDALRYYGSSWRRTQSVAHLDGGVDEDGLMRQRPNRRNASVDLRRAPVSSGSSSSSGASPRDEVDADLIPEGARPPSQLALSPHDLRAATRRTRAPVLRVFVPCTDHAPRTIARCEDALARAGLWDALSTGDVVCNVGYIPPSRPHTPASSGSRVDLSSDAGGSNEPTQTWLLFNGARLVPYTPPAPPALGNPGALPSPFYYAHLAPAGANPRFVLALPALPQPPAMSLTADVPAQVASPHSPRGRALIRRHVWVARVRARPMPGLGAGWAGEWVLEGGGTREGRQSVLDSLRGGPAAEREWEIVRERSGAGRIWFRLVDRAAGNPASATSSTPPPTPPKTAHHHSRV